MLESSDIYNLLDGHGINFFAGVPDSLLKDFCAYIDGHVPQSQHIIAANEGNAIALATGHYLATGNPGCVYMQNSGLGNAINPLTSLTDQHVYSIPMLLIIGWRGKPGVHDEPQHRKQGAITQKLLQTLDIPFAILPKELAAAKDAVEKAVETLKQSSAPYALVVQKDTFAPYASKIEKGQHELTREKALNIILDQLNDQDIVVSTTGKTSREVFEYRKQKQQGHEKDFLVVGSMGHASSVALTIALENENRAVWCLDGDGAAIMHMGALTIIGQYAPQNLRHIILNNGAHESVGGQPTAGFLVDFKKIAQGCGYKSAYTINNESNLQTQLETIRSVHHAGPTLLEIQIKQGSRKNLGRPTRTPKKNKEDFMNFLTL